MTIFDKYKIIKTVDDGEDTSLYIVREVATDKQFVLKKIPADTSSPVYKTVINEFEEVKKVKARIDKRPDSPYIIDFFVEEENTYLLLEYKDEKSLKTITSYPSIGKILNNRYIVARGIAGGGFGIVYLARDLNLPGKYWALKEMQEEGTLPEIIEKSFRVEAEMLSKLEHESIPRISDFFIEEGMLYLVMDYVQGETLKKKLKDLEGKKFPEEQVISLAISLCDVLSYLHNRPTPIVFRDLKPDNIMLTDEGNIKLVDFGIARVFQGSKVETTKYALLTEGYAPQEQWLGKAEPRSDIYSLGVTLYHIVTGKHPKAIAPNFPPVEEFNPSISPGLSKIIMKSIEPKIADRHENIEEMKKEFLNLFSQKEVDEKVKSHINKGKEFESRGDYFNGNFEYMKALEYDRNNYEILYGVARCCKELGFLEKAGEHYRKILTLEISEELKKRIRKNLDELEEVRVVSREKTVDSEETLHVALPVHQKKKGPKIRFTVREEGGEPKTSPVKKGRIYNKILLGCVVILFFTLLLSIVLIALLVCFVPALIPVIIELYETIVNSL